VFTDNWGLGYQAVSKRSSVSQEMVSSDLLNQVIGADGLDLLYLSEQLAKTLTGFVGYRSEYCCRTKEDIGSWFTGRNMGKCICRRGDAEYVRYQEHLAPLD